MKQKICIAMVLLIFGCCAVYLLYPIPFSDYTKDCDSITVIYIDNSIEHTPTRTAVFDKGSDAFSGLTALLGRFSFHRSLRSFMEDTHLSNNYAGYWLYIYIDSGDERRVLTCGGTGEIAFDWHIYRMGYWGRQAALSFMSQIVEIAFPEA